MALPVEEYEFWRRHVRQWQDSGLTQSAYAARYQIDRAGLCRWQQRLADSPTLDAPITLVPATRLTDTGPMVLCTGAAGRHFRRVAGRPAGAPVMMPAPELVFLAVQPVDMRLGIDGLPLLIQQATGHSPCDGNGIWLCHRRLHTGRFKWPAVGNTIYPLTSEQWQWLVIGVDRLRLKAPPPAHWQL